MNVACERIIQFRTGCLWTSRNFLPSSIQSENFSEIFHNFSHDCFYLKNKVTSHFESLNFRVQLFTHRHAFGNVQDDVSLRIFDSVQRLAQHKDNCKNEKKLLHIFFIVYRINFKRTWIKQLPIDATIRTAGTKNAKE